MVFGSYFFGGEGWNPAKAGELARDFHMPNIKNCYELEARLRARWRRTLSRLPQSRESHHLRLSLRLSSRNTQPQPSPAQSLTLSNFGDIKSSAADLATDHKGLSSGAPPSSPLQSHPQP